MLFFLYFICYLTVTPILVDSTQSTTIFSTTSINTTINSIKDDAEPFCARVKNICLNCNEYSLECRGLNTTNFDLLKNSFESIQSITFTGNRLGIVAESLFKHEMNQLAFLDLSNNKILRIGSSNVFKNVPNLFELILDNNVLNLDSKQHFSSLKMFSNSLERLSLNSAFTGSKSIDYIRSAQIDSEIRSLLSLSKLNNLFELRLRQNSLTSFNLKASDQAKDLIDEYDEFKDILCILPKLKVLYLDHNFIDKIDFDLNCLNENKSNLELLHLETNRISTINSDFIEKLKTFAAFNPDFRVQLLDNPFKCDCSLFSFFSWLKSDESTNVVYNKFNLICTHEDSLASTLYKPIVNSNLDEFCSDLKMTTISSTTRRRLFFPFRNRTYRLKNPEGQKPFVANKLVIFLFSVVFISLVVVLVTKYQCKRKWNQGRMNRYSTLDNNFTGTSVDGIRIPSANNNQLTRNEENDELMHDAIFERESKTKLVTDKFGHYLNKATQMSKKFKGNNDANETVSSSVYFN